MGLFGATHGWGEKRPSSLKFVKQPTIMKLGTVILHVNKIQKYINGVTHSMSSADISIFSAEISNFSRNADID